MNRAERRRAEKAARKRRRWNDNIMHFTHAAKGALETYVISAADYPLLVASAAGGDPTAIALARSVTIWIREACSRSVAEPGNAFLCLDCDQQFGPRVGVEPVAFSIAMPFANRDVAIVTGICRRCTERGEDLQQMALRRLQLIWPDAYTTQGGRA